MQNNIKGHLWKEINKIKKEIREYLYKLHINSAEASHWSGWRMRMELRTTAFKTWTTHSFWGIGAILYSAVAMFRLVTGHDCLNKHLHRIGIIPSPHCPLCSKHEEMDMEHLMHCAALQNLQDITSKYWEARKRITSLLTLKN